MQLALGGGIMLRQQNSKTLESSLNSLAGALDTHATHHAKPRLNRRKLTVAGLASGIVLVAFEIVVNAPLFTVMSRAGLNAQNPAFSDSPPGAAAIIGLVALLFVLGFVLVWNYAAMTPRFGQGPKSAFLAGLSVWLVFYAAVGLDAAIGLYDWDYVALGILPWMIMFQAGAQVGAKLYAD